MAVLRQDAVSNSVEARRRSKAKTLKEAAWKLVVYVLLFAGAVVFVAPFAWMVTASLQDVGDMFRWPPSWIPRNPSLNNYVKFLQAGDLGLWLFNSAYVAIAVTVLQLFFNSLAAYTFAKRRFPGRDTLFLIFLGTIMIPGQVLLIPTYLILKNIPLFGGNNIFGQGGHGWLDSYWGLIAPGAVSTFGIFFLRQYMLSIPDDLLDAARIDGAGELRIYTSIVLPVIRPILATLAIWTFLTTWNDFMWPLVVLYDQSKYTLPVALASLVGEHVQDTELMMAGSVLTVFPVLIVFLVLQRYYIEGVMLGSVKG